MTRPGVITNENRQTKYHSPIPKVFWGTEHLSDEEQDIIRYVGDIVEEGQRILKRLDAGSPISKALWKEWKSYIRAARQILDKLEKENLTK